MKKIALGTDHACYEMKEVLKVCLYQKGYEDLDFETDSEEAVDYPDYCRPSAESVAVGDCKCRI
jgi:ribose 5-phosphate isomerase B